MKAVKIQSSSSDEHRNDDEGRSSPYKTTPISFVKSGLSEQDL